MTSFNQLKIFQKVALIVFNIFITIMAVLITMAYMRKSGSTGLNMFNMHEARSKRRLKTANNLYDSP
jgi:hypothetical protein